MRRLVLVLMLSLSGCTIAFGALGGVSAHSANRDAHEHGKPETASVGARIVVGALLGLAVDSFILYQSLDGCCPSSFEVP